MAGRASTAHTTARGAETRTLAEELRERVSGEVRFDDGDRALYATDASNYRQAPIGVVLPKSIEDIVATVEVCRRFGAPVLPRGGGTSLAGQCCNVAVVVDTSKYMHRVLEIDPDRSWPGSSPASCSTTCAARPSATTSPSAPIPPPTTAARSAA